MSETLAKLADLYKAADNDIECIDDETFEVVEAGEWEQDHKYQYATHIVKLDGQFFAVSENRSGSYHTDWFYGDADIFPVDRVEETKVVVTWPVSGPSVSVPGRY
jgi:hypothetical protein